MNYFKFSKFLLFASVFSVDIVSRATVFPFIVGKYVFFRTAIDAALTLFALGMIFSDQAGHYLNRFLKIIRSPFVVAVTVFVVIFLLAGAFGIDPATSFWSNFERGEGGLQILHIYAFFMLLLLLFESEKDWRSMFWAFTAASFLLILYGVMAQFGLFGLIGPYPPSEAPVTVWGKLTAARFQGSLGNPAYVGTFLIFSLFYLVYLWINGECLSSRRLIKNLIFGFLAFLFLFFSVMSQTRGAFMGLAAGLIAFLLYIIFTSGDKVRKWGIIALSCLAIIGGTLIYFGDSAFVQSLPGGRIFSLSFKERTAQTRFWTWGTALNAWKERPLLGWGPENFSSAFDKYFDTRHFVPGQNSETWFDRAHSVYLDYLAETGILGFLSFISIFVIFYKDFFKTRLGLGHINGGLLFAMPVFYLVQGLVIFDVLPVYISLFLFLAFAHYKFMPIHEPISV